MKQPSERRGIFIFDEDEAARAPRRQIEVLKLLKDIEQAGQALDDKA